MSQRARTLLLLTLFAVVTFAVVADRMGLPERLRGGGDAGSATPAAAYESAARALAGERQLIAQRSEWEAALRRAEQRARELDKLTHRAPTEQIAAAEIRNRLTDAIRGNGATAPTVKARPPAKPPEGVAAPEVRIITFEVAFDTFDPASAFAIIDLLENMPDLATNITSATIRGPGLKQISSDPLTVALEVQTIAIIGGES